MEVCDSDSDDELPPGWEERATFQGQVYYANHNTQETQWTHPRTKKRKYVPAKLPFGWVRELLPDGKILYVDHRTKRTTYSDPRLAFAVEQENKDFRQRFDASTRALQILHGLDLSDHIAVITGANSGIGFETARTLAFHGCTVIFACRNIIKAEIAIGLLANERPGIKCFALYCDLSSFQSVAEFSRNFNSEYTKLDVLILNAGVFGLPYSKTSDGYETMTQVNFLSHFYLSHLLRPSLIKASHPKIVAVSTESHRFSSLHKSDDIDPSLFSYKPSDFFSTQVYNNSKCMLLMAALEMDRRWQRMGIRVLAVHPGNCVNTKLSHSWWPYRVLFKIVQPFTKSWQQAASASVFAAFSPEMKTTGGLYINNCFPCKPHDIIFDTDANLLLWDITLQAIENKINHSFI